MFETAELGHRVAKTVFNRAVPKLRADLLDFQYRLKENGTFPVIVLISGVRGAGKGETVNLLNEWMDPRHILTHAFDTPSDEERDRPPMWRYWLALPPKGKIGILFGSWYTAPIIDRVFRNTGRGDLLQSIEEINRFEKMLADEGALIVKFWFHLSKEVQRRRLKTLRSDPETRWRVTRRDWDFFRRYDRFYRISGETLRATSTADAPWIVVEGADPPYRSLTVGKALLGAMKKRLAAPAGRGRPVSRAAPIVHPIDERNVLSELDLSRTLTEKAYKADLSAWQGRLNRLARHAKFPRLSVALAFEGMDAAGKGSTIRRVTAAMDARSYHVIPVAAPTDEERAQPYLWRFWRNLPRKGRVTIYDRTWYGRVLVERIEGFCAEADWMRAYAEINDFEEQLERSRIVLCKFWMQISREEQLRRFRERERTRFKRFKITPEDWRNRGKWDLYQSAAADMIERTSTPGSPWTLVEANDKKFARIKVLKTICKRIERTLDTL
ncbi:MAG TPA: polyphosphate:AMP phosphotransferase [Thermoanaerobaculia bacterium]|nr:polyphosphate:AMP phosphotransferase [Thermoanaerobaculia bacterium]